MIVAKTDYALKESANVSINLKDLLVNIVSFFQLQSIKKLARITAQAKENVWMENVNATQDLVEKLVQ